MPPLRSEAAQLALRPSDKPLDHFRSTGPYGHLQVFRKWCREGAWQYPLGPSAPRISAGNTASPCPETETGPWLCFLAPPCPYPECSQGNSYSLKPVSPEACPARTRSSHGVPFVAHKHVLTPSTYKKVPAVWCFFQVRGNLAHKTNNLPWDPTVGLCLGPYGGLGGGPFLMSEVPLYRRNSK